ncbi:MAG TPA: hypothetical protein VKN18_01925 [Blastocatellia bacterium]|nr:hypothetical protein [Blastocatellia bacterium]
MLRISVHDKGESTRFNIEGKLTAAVASELEGCWHAAQERQPLKPLVVELAAVSFVDSESRELLTRMRRCGVRFVPTGCLMEAIVDQIESEVAKSV